MKDKYIKRRVKNKAVVDLETSEMQSFSSNVKLHSYTDFFIAALAAWGKFKMSDGLKIKVFIHCIMASAPSTVDSTEGNYFYVSDVYKSIEAESKKKGEDVMSENNIRQYIAKLADDEALLRTATRGKYRINPEYGIKGVITDKTYGRILIEKMPSKRIKPNKGFEEKGGEG
jgi:hypothetical protein